MSIPERRIGLYSQGSSGWTSIRYEELQEDDVWGGFHEREEFTPKAKESSSSTLRRLPTVTKMIPRSNKNPSHEPKMIQHSAPVNIPDWSKIYGTTSKASYNPSLLNDNYGHNQGKEGDGFVRSGWNSDDEEDNEDGGQMVPPHEWLARKLARSQISSFSVCEGIGRTLKGRDLKRVRNAVLTKTGFLE